MPRCCFHPLATALLLLATAISVPVGAQAPDRRALKASARPDVAPLDELRAADGTRSGAELLIPAGSLALPGFGQYMHGAPLSGAGFTLAGVLGASLAGTAAAPIGALPRDSDEQIAGIVYHNLTEEEGSPAGGAP